jgi:hypothetical protein
MQEQKEMVPTNTRVEREEREERSLAREGKRAGERERANSNEECSVVYMTTSAALKRHFRRERNKEWVGGGFCFFI